MAKKRDINLRLHNFTILANQELGEIPFDVAGQDASLFTLEEAIQRISCTEAIEVKQQV